LMKGTVAAVFVQLRYLNTVEIETDAHRTGPSSANEDRAATLR